VHGNAAKLVGDSAWIFRTDLPRRTRQTHLELARSRRAVHPASIASKRQRKTRSAHEYRSWRPNWLRFKWQNGTARLRFWKIHLSRAIRKLLSIVENQLL